VFSPSQSPLRQPGSRTAPWHRSRVPAVPPQPQGHSIGQWVWGVLVVRSRWTGVWYRGFECYIEGIVGMGGFVDLFCVGSFWGMVICLFCVVQACVGFSLREFVRLYLWVERVGLWFCLVWVIVGGFLLLSNVFLWCYVGQLSLLYWLNWHQGLGWRKCFRKLFVSFVCDLGFALWVSEGDM